eukprot:248500_1
MNELYSIPYYNQFGYGDTNININNINNKKRIVKDLIQAINTNYKAITNGIITGFEDFNNITQEIKKQLMVQAQSNHDKLRIENQRETEEIKNLNDLIKNSFGKLEKILINNLNTKLDKMSKYLIKNQINTQNELKELRKQNNNIINTQNELKEFRKENNNIITKINNTEKKIDKKLSEIYKQINKSFKWNKNNIKEKDLSNTILEQRVNESMGKQINNLRLDLSLIHKEYMDLFAASTNELICTQTNETAANTIDTNNILTHLNKLELKIFLENKEKIDYVMDKLDELGNANVAKDETNDIIDTTNTSSENSSINEPDININASKENKEIRKYASKKLNLNYDYNIIDNDYNIKSTVDISNIQKLNKNNIKNKNKNNMNKNENRKTKRLQAPDSIYNNIPIMPEPKPPEYKIYTSE